MYLRDLQRMGAKFTQEKFAPVSGTKCYILGKLEFDNTTTYVKVLFSKYSISRVVAVCGESMEDCNEGRRHFRKWFLSNFIRNKNGVWDNIGRRWVKRVLWAFLLLAAMLGCVIGLWNTSIALAVPSFGLVLSSGSLLYTLIRYRCKFFFEKMR